MFNELFGSKTAERVLMFLENYEEGYGASIADTYEISISQVQKQLERLEKGQILASKLIGRTRVYSFNKRFPLYKELRSLLKEAMRYVPDENLKKYYRNRMRPRRSGKPL